MIATESTSLPFGEFRSLLQRPPSASVWEELCMIIEREWLDDRHRAEMVLIPYAQRALMGWPDELRRMPLPWLNYIGDGEFAPCQLVRAVRLKRHHEITMAQLHHWTEAIPLTIMDLSACHLSAVQRVGLGLFERVWSARLVL